MSAAAAYMNPYGLPWSLTPDIRRFQRILAASIAVVLLLSFLIPLLSVPPPPAFEAKPVESTMQIIVEAPKPIVVQPPEEQIRPPKPMPEAKRPLQMKKPVVVPPTTKPVEVVKESREATVSHAREKAAVSGLLQFKDSFADMRDAVDVTKLSDTGGVRRGPGTAATLDRSMLTSKHGTRSAGVNLGSLSRDTGGVALSGRETTKVDVPEGTVGNGGVKSIDQEEANGDSVDAHGRSIEEIRRVFDANKGAIFAIYNRALRQNPGLKGQLVIELVIDPSGQVVDCRAVSSELADQDLVAKIVSRIRLFDFGSRDVALTKINYPVHFLPT